MEHVERLAAAEADPAPLPDREAVLAEVVTDDGAGGVDDRPGTVPERPVARQEPLATGAGQEAEVLRVGLARDRQTGAEPRSA